MEKKCWFIILACLAFVEADNPQLITKENATSFIEDSFFDPAILKARNKPMYVSYLKVNADLVIRMVSGAIAKDRNNTCQILVTIPRDYGSTRPTAQMLGNRKLIVGFVETRSDIDNPNSTARFFVVDWDNKCTSSNFSIPFSDQIIRTDKPFQIITYNDSFDLFTKSHLLCKLPNNFCAIRYKSKGKRTGTRQLGFLPAHVEMHSLRLYPLYEYQDRGYVLVSLESNSVWRLGRELRLLKEVRLAQRLVAHSVSSGRVFVCSREEERIPVQEHCLELNPSPGSASLEVLSNKTLTESEGFRRVGEAELPGGGLVTLARERSAQQVRLRLGREDVDGGPGGESEFLVRCPSLPAPRYTWLLVFEDELCCFSVKCIEGRLTHCARAPEGARGRLVLPEAGLPGPSTSPRQ